MSGGNGRGGQTSPYLAKIEGSCEAAVFGG